jgi:hypothetical protein
LGTGQNLSPRQWILTIEKNSLRHRLRRTGLAPELRFSSSSLNVVDVLSWAEIHVAATWKLDIPVRPAVGPTALSSWTPYTPFSICAERSFTSALRYGRRQQIDLDYSESPGHS